MDNQQQQQQQQQQLQLHVVDMVTGDDGQIVITPRSAAQSLVPADGAGSALTAGPGEGTLVHCPDFISQDPAA